MTQYKDHHEHEPEHDHDHITELSHLPCDGEGHEHHHHADGSCCCEHHAQEFHGIDRPMLIRLILSAVLYLVALLLPVGETAEAILMICAAVIAGCDIVWGALKNLLRARFFDEYFLMSFAAVAAFLIGEYEEAAAVFVLYRIGAFCQSYAIRHSRLKILQLTGEEAFPEREEKVQNRFIARFARVYTPIILILAVLISLALPLLGKATWHDGIYRALTFLVLACPCAIVISVPLAYFAGIGAAAKKGIYFHDAASVDAAAANKFETVSAAAASNDVRSALVYELHDAEGNSSRMLLSGSEQMPLAVSIAKNARRVALENVWFTILIKLAVLILSVFGVSALWFAVFADSGVTVLVVLNALRAFYVGKKVKG